VDCAATSLFSQGVAYDNKGQFDDAIRKYDLAIRLSPNFALAFYNRGLDYVHKGQLDCAIEDYNQAIRLNRSNRLILSAITGCRRCRLLCKVG
jgi:tetratricopeptide (TPR) repeat protein